MKVSLVALLVVIALAGANAGCHWELGYKCAPKKAVECGSDWCYGKCVEVEKEECGKKEFVKEICKEDKKEVCKEILTPCGDDKCKADEKCVTEDKCELVPVAKKADFHGWGWYESSYEGAYVKMCKEEKKCEKADEWEIDEKYTDLVCKKTYKVEEDISCEAFWPKMGISKYYFFKYNRGFDCGPKMVGKVVCVEAEAKLKKPKCGDEVCHEGYECVEEEDCKEIVVKEPVCEKEVVEVCKKSDHEHCGPYWCGSDEECKVEKVEKCKIEKPVIKVVKVPVPAPKPDPKPAPKPSPEPVPEPESTSSSVSSATATVDEDGNTDATSDVVVSGNGTGDATGEAVTEDNESIATSSANGAEDTTFTDAVAVAGDGDADATATADVVESG